VRSQLEAWSLESGTWSSELEAWSLELNALRRGSSGGIMLKKDKNRD
jgi:hypothetical protein